MLPHWVSTVSISVFYVFRLAVDLEAFVLRLDCTWYFTGTVTFI